MLKLKTSISLVTLLLLILVVPSFTAEDRPGVAALLIGLHEVPSVLTKVHGEFKAKLSDDGTQIQFTLKYADLEGTPTAAHIHFGQRFANGGIIATLCGGSKPACLSAGMLLSGTLVAADITGPAGQGIDAGNFAKALRAIRSGHTYVNVHTDKFGDGEIRGQIRHRYHEDDDNND